jgi:hypothetical protein
MHFADVIKKSELCLHVNMNVEGRITAKASNSMSLMENV